MKYFLSGGSKSGKSMLAQSLAKRQAVGHPLYYVATMVPADEEDEKRIARHLVERAGWGFETVECGHDIPAGLAKCDRQSSFLLDSLTALLSNEMFLPTGAVDLQAPDRVAQQLQEICSQYENLVIVSDEIYCDSITYDPLTEAFRAGLAKLDRVAAAHCDTVCQVRCGIPTVWKGTL